MDPQVTAANRCGEEGFALVLALLALMVLAAIATAAAVAAVGQLRAAGMAGRVMSGRAAALGGVERILEETRGPPRTAVGGEAAEMAADSFGGTGLRRVHDLRVEREFHLLIGEAERGGGIPMRVARVVWWMEPESRVAAYRAVVESSSFATAPSARVLVDSVLAGRVGLAACDSLPLLSATLGRGATPATGALPQPPEWGGGNDGPSFENMRLGWFDAATMAALADFDLSGDGTLVPGCPDCWSGVVFGSSRLRVEGSGAGVLAVDGNLTFASGVAWTGLVLSSGDVTFETGAGLAGLVRAGGTVTLGDSAVVDGSACAAMEALENAAALLRPIPVAGRSWIGPIPPGVK
ncbi:MAG: hypothetical protein OXL34_04570 [Gemmatimonadota bacterium]|nr:hypothetical protein [Gemmatimonadota bacterium]